MNSKRTLNVSTLIALLFLPIVFRRKYKRQSIAIYFISAIGNVILDKYYLSKNSFYYPIRYLPKLFKINILYDLLVLPIFTAAYCQTSSNSSLKGIIGQNLLYTSIQASIEDLMLKRTKLIQHNQRKWSIGHTFLTLYCYKLVIRGLWSIINPLMSNKKLKTD